LLAGKIFPKNAFSSMPRILFRRSLLGSAQGPGRMKVLFHNLDTQDNHILKVKDLKEATDILRDVNALRPSWFVTHIISGSFKCSIGYHYKQVFHIR